MFSLQTNVFLLIQEFLWDEVLGLQNRSVFREVRNAPNGAILDTLVEHRVSPLRHILGSLPTAYQSQVFGLNFWVG